MPNAKARNETLSLDEILGAEFRYAVQTAAQAHEERAQATSFYLISIGSFLAALLGSRSLSGNTRAISMALAGLFFLLTILGFLTILQLARLRAAWHDSARTMNHIKEYYIGHFKGSRLEKAFRWRMDTLPEKYKLSSISFIQAFEVALMSGFIFGAAAYYFQVGIGGTPWLWAITFSLGILVFLMELFVYKRYLEG
jgi:hypothetical protein